MKIWEGKKGMKRMKKKVVAMVTLAMFVMTLLPMAAFAADADPQVSKFVTAKQNVEVSVGDDVDATIQMLANDNSLATTEKDVYVWAEENGNISSAAQFVGGTPETKNELISKYSVMNGSQEIKVKFTRSGNFTLKAACAGGVNAGTTADAAFDGKNATYLKSVEGYNKVVVTDEAAEVNSMKIAQVDNSNLGNGILADKKTIALNDVVINGIDKDEFTLTALDKDGKLVTEKDVTVKSNSSNLVVTGDTKTDALGNMTVKYQAKAAGKYTITVSVDSYKAYLTVDIKGDAVTPEYINVAKDGGVVDTNADKTQSGTFVNAVQFKITDKNGNELTKDEWAKAKEPIRSGNEIAKYVEIVNQPKKSLDPQDIRVVYNAKEDVFTLKLASNKTLAKGDYTVKVALKSNDSAEFTFKVAEVGDPVELIIDGPKEVKAGGNYKATLKYVDANGIETNAFGTQLIAGYYKTASVATAGNDFDVDSDNQISFVARDGEAYYGTKVTLYVMDNENNFYVEKDVTVVDPAVADKYTVQFDNLEGAINKDNTVKVSVLDADGEVAKTVKNAAAQAYVAKVSDADANVTIDKEFTVNNGKGDLKVYADKACTADIVVAIKDADGKIYAGNFTYTFGKQDIPADTSVVMTLGSTEMLVNNNIVDMKDAAPFAQDNRTFVPFRALGEALGATVDYDQTAKTVTYKLGSTEIVMTLDSKDYTVNGVKKTMDVAPFAKDNRTYVPVRFVGEGLGFTVTGLTNANGQYVAVAFTK